VGDRAGEAATLSNIGVVYDSLGQKQKVLEFYNQALPLYKAVGDRGGEAITLNNIGAVYNSLGEKQKALEFYNQALPLYKAVRDRGGEANTLYNVASLQRSQGNLKSALTLMDSAITIVEDLRTKIGSQELRTSYFATVQNYYEFYIDLLMQLHQQNPNQGYDALALHASEHSRARSLLELLTEANADIRQGVEPQLIEEERTLQQQLDAIEKRRVELFSGNYTEEQATAIEQEREQLLSQYRDIQTKIRTTSPRYAALTQPEPLTLEEIQQQVLDEDTLLLQYSLGTERSYLWAVSKTGISSYELPPREEIETAAKQFYELLKTPGFQLQSRSCTNPDNPPGVKTPGSQLKSSKDDWKRVSVHLSGLELLAQSLNSGQVSEPVENEARCELEQRSCTNPDNPPGVQTPGSQLKSSKDDWTRASVHLSGLELLAQSLNSGGVSEPVENAAGCEEDTRGSIRVENVKATKAVSQLSQMLLAPVAEELGNKRLLIVGDGALQYIPFSALPLPETSGEDVVPLLANNEMVNLPSATTLGIIRQEQATRKTAPKAIAILADPVFSSDDERVTNSKQKSDRTLPQQLLNRSARETDIGVWERLPGTRTEAEAIMALVPDSERVHGFDFAANREMITNPELSNYRIVHLATHGLLNSTNPELSGVVLSLFDEQGDSQNGFLRLHDVFNLNLPAELVVLSACQTGLGQEVKGEGLVGLTRGFMYAGSPRVLVSLWNVSDAATAEMMKRFYRNMLQEGLSATAALRAAQLEMQQETQWKAPYYWAAFTLQGEWK